MNANQVDTLQYWEQRLRARSTLQGTGHRAFSEQYNQVLYRAQAECLDNLFDRASISLASKGVLDVGSGTGFFLRYFQNRGACPVIGTDLTYASVSYLNRTLAGVDVLQCDVSAPNLPFQQTFDIVNCISVLYHVLDDRLFTHALTNLCRWVTPGGCLVVSDMFKHVHSARHARFRSIEVYKTILRNNHLSFVALLPVYFLLNRVFIPAVGPKLIDAFQLGEWLYRLDRRIRNIGVTSGASMYFLLAKRI